MGLKQEEEDVKGCMGGFCVEAPDEKVCTDELLCDEMQLDDEEFLHPLAVEALAILFPKLVCKGVCG
eukprot:13347-Eustigmatos_ZCMA.PRE.1